jgi:hypothetical protein
MTSRDAVALALISLAWSCHGGGEEASGSAEPPASNPPPAVSAVEVIPPIVYVRPTDVPGSATFELEARLWTTLSSGRRIISPFYGFVPTWTTDQDALPPDERWVTVEPLSGHSARVTVKGAFPPVPVEALVTASVSGVVSAPSARIVVVPDPSTTNEDRVVHEPHGDGDMPAIALVTGMRESDVGTTLCTTDSVFAIVRSALLGHVMAQCPGGQGSAGSEVALFSSKQAMLPEAVNWTLGNDAVDQAGIQMPVRTLPVVLWIAIDGRNLESPTASALADLRQRVKDQATDDVELANAIFAANRVGAAVSIDAGSPQILTTFSSLGRPDFSCPDGDRIIQEASSLTPVEGKLNVYYVDELGPHVRGLTCTLSRNRAEDLVYVSWAAHSPPTLAHEVGHSLGLLFPDDGHTQSLAGFDPTNLMTSYLPDDQAAGIRDHLTLGQAFRMNVDSASWLNLPASGPIREASALRLACPCDPYVSRPCPGLPVDVATIDVGDFQVAPWKCADVVLLTSTDASNDGVGLAAGHRWRDAPAQCTKAVAGTPYHWAGDVRIRLLFDNLSDPGGCPAWVAAFFRDQGMMYLDLGSTAAPPFAFTDDLDEADWAASPPPVYDVPVNVWASSAPVDLTSLVATDVATATGVFHGDNRTGIKLVVQQTPDETITAAGVCALTPAAPHKINVYYVPSTDPIHDVTQNHDGHWCRVGDTDYIVIATGVLYSKTALGHFLGHAMGLSDATVSDGLTSSNVMWDQGSDARTSFSLGQVFRMNLDVKSWLNTSTESPRTEGVTLDCSGGDAPRCPELAATPP